MEADFCMIARGDGMIGARICDGDTVYFKSQDHVENGEIAAVVVGGEVLLKRSYFYPDKKQLVLRSENPQCEPLIYTGIELNDINVIGKAVSFEGNVF